MTGATFITPSETAELLGQDAVTVIDCRFRLADPEWGRASYAAGHVPRASYAHLDQDLAQVGGGGGRHPLPWISRLHASLRRWGVSAGRQVVVYDDASGAIAARLWWLLRYAGHRETAILDGGWPAWLSAGLPVSRDCGAQAGGDARFDHGRMPVVDAIGERLDAGGVLLIDARGALRYAGESEPIDALAGHVPGAVNRPFEANLKNGRLKPKARLAAEWRALLAGVAPERVIHMCGSGVTACLNLACMEHLGACGSGLFVPSWSGWIENPDNPIATGMTPGGNQPG